MWPFRKKLTPPPTILDRRDWNDDWKVGDIAECIVEADGWGDLWKPWERVPKGQRFTVAGFKESDDAICEDGRCSAYFLIFAETKKTYPTQCFRKVRPVASEDSEIVTRILNAQPGTDNVRESA